MLNPTLLFTGRSSQVYCTVSSNAHRSKEWLSYFSAFLLGSVLPVFRSFPGTAAHLSVSRGPITSGGICSNTWWQQRVASMEWWNVLKLQIQRGIGKLRNIVEFYIYLFFFWLSTCVFLHSLCASLHLQIWLMHSFWGNSIQCVISQRFLQITRRSNTILRNTSVLALLIHWPFSACFKLRLHKQPLTLYLVPSGGWGMEAETDGEMQRKGFTVLCHVLAPLLQNEEFPFEHSSGTDICSSLCFGVRGNTTCGTEGSLFF